MVLILGLWAPPGSGKDCAADYLVEHHKFHRLAFADAIREALLVLDPCLQGPTRLSEVVAEHGWEQAKSNRPEVRRLLQVLGTELGRDLHGPVVWVNKVFERVDALARGSRVVISDVRFGNEAQAVRSRGGIVVRINRHIRPPDVVMDHASERASAGITPDYVLPNVATLHKFYGRLDRLVYRQLAMRRNLC